MPSNCNCEIGGNDYILMNRLVQKNKVENKVSFKIHNSKKLKKKFR
jgi:hypothetical protein